MKILVMGAGAVGNYFGARLQQAGEDVIFCARGENLRVLREKGLEIQSPRGDIAIRVKATDDLVRAEACTHHEALDAERSAGGQRRKNGMDGGHELSLSRAR